jgi:hypothetical protein
MKHVGTNVHTNIRFIPQTKVDLWYILYAISCDAIVILISIDIPQTDNLHGKEMEHYDLPEGNSSLYMLRCLG